MHAYICMHLLRRLTYLVLLIFGPNSAVSSAFLSPMRAFGGSPPLAATGYWSGGYCPAGAHCPYQENMTDNTAFAALHFGLDGMAVQYVDSEGGVLWTSRALPRRKHNAGEM
jgi:hypothetical protein